MDGTIKVKSKLGEGTTFVVCIDARPTADSAQKQDYGYDDENLKGKECYCVKTIH